MRVLLSCVALAATDKCSKRAGGSCLSGSCNPGLGPTVCAGVCLCADGTCADEDGVCQPSIVDWCNTDTGGTCAHSSCENFRGPSTCYNGKCICQKGYCADSTGVCQPTGKGVAEVWSNVLDNSASDFKCSRVTGGTCFGGTCSTGRGPTSCVFGACLCDSTTCSDDQGICHPVFIPGTDNIMTGGTCYATNCSSFRGPTTCKDHKCNCQEGYYADLTGVCRAFGTPLYSLDGQTQTGSSVTQASLAAAAFPMPLTKEPCQSTYSVILPSMIITMIAVNFFVRRSEKPQRSAAAFSADLFKQMSAFALVVMFNLSASDRLADVMGGSVCSWFAAGVAAFAVVGVVVATAMGKLAHGVVRSSVVVRPADVMMQATAWCGIVGLSLMASVAVLMMYLDSIAPLVNSMGGSVAVAVVPAAASGLVAAASDRVLKAQWRGQVAATEPLLSQ
mmetsp:Transcript_49833/g.108793  ORF Transcript_49833/g.108793 Transcript_49833/m.108793 type:complete len:447 (-) Transcript_49833:90-1430(-)